jgi:hypothetical protein
MSESESEDEILDRIEAALRKIADAPGAGRLLEGHAPESDVPDRDALTEKLDGIIARLRDGLGGSARGLEGVPARIASDDAPPDVAPPKIWPERGE